MSLDVFRCREMSLDVVVWEGGFLCPNPVRAARAVIICSCCCCFAHTVKGGGDEEDARERVNHHSLKW